MALDKAVEKDLADLLVLMNSDLKYLDHAYAELLEVIKAEYAAVSTHTIDQFEAALKKKKVLAKSIEAIVASIKTKVLHLGTIAGQGEDADVSLSSALTLVESFIKNSNESMPLSQKVKVLLHTSKEAIERILQMYQTVFLEIKKNRHILSRLLYNHQESYRFWQEICGESSSSYNEKGNKKNEAKISQFSVKA